MEEATTVYLATTTTNPENAEQFADEWDCDYDSKFFGEFFTDNPEFYGMFIDEVKFINGFLCVSVVQLIRVEKITLCWWENTLTPDILEQFTEFFNKSLSKLQQLYPMNNYHFKVDKFCIKKKE